MASQKAEKNVGSQAGKKEPAKAPVSKQGLPNKTEVKPREPKKKGTPGSKSGGKK
ncbi:hypothetical protein CDL12_19973 [Handroanthus impetiginosus]|uniref:Uncharacterized protein n=1 Tax=Handroanthus impetiginosus TaxID=429701 RepID=A0A2G9GQ92_9LAMI|nr:hypothetical protein CDL12_19973 [Handroanthus impetiginosus]